MKNYLLSLVNLTYFYVSLFLFFQKISAIGQELNPGQLTTPFTEFNLQNLPDTIRIRTNYILMSEPGPTNTFNFEDDVNYRQIVKAAGYDYFRRCDPPYVEYGYEENVFFEGLYKLKSYNSSYLQDEFLLIRQANPRLLDYCSSKKSTYDYYHHTIQDNIFVNYIGQAFDLFYYFHTVSNTNTARLNMRLLSFKDHAIIMNSPNAAQPLQWATPEGPQRAYQKQGNLVSGDSYNYTTEYANIPNRGFEVKYPGTYTFVPFNNTWEELFAHHDPFTAGIFTFRGYVQPFDQKHYSPEVFYNHQPQTVKVTIGNPGMSTLPGPGYLQYHLLNGAWGETIEFANSMQGYLFDLSGGTYNVNRSIKIKGYDGSTPIHIRMHNAHVGPLLRINSSATVSMENITLENSGVINQNGGAIDNKGNLTLKNCTLSNNLANRGGAVYHDGSNLFIENCTLSGNTANDGGGIFSNPNNIKIRFSTIVNNHANNFSTGYNNYKYYNGGGIYLLNNAGFEIVGTIVAKNTASADNIPNDVGGGGYINSNISYGYNLYGVAPTMDVPLVSTDLAGSVEFPLNPQIGPLATNGVTNRPKTHGLSPCGSPAINAGGIGPTTDQRGRPLVGQRDIGAFELQATDAQIAGVRYVSNADADGPGSLKYIMEHLSCPNDTVRFNPSLSGSKIILNGIITPNANVVVDAQTNKITIDANGGARILEVGNRTVFLNNLTLTGVNRTGSSGVFSVLNSGKLFMQGCLIHNNKVSQKGGIVYLISGALFKASNTTFSGNEAVEQGGAFYVDGGVATFENCTIAYNKTTSTNTGNGGGAFAINTGQVFLRNSIIAQNTSASTGQDIRQYNNGLFSIDYNIFGKVETNSGSITFQPNDLHGTLASPVDPIFSPLQDKGGPTRCHAVSCDGPAKNTGFYSFSNETNINNDARIDQRLQPRTAPYDRGAVEDETLSSTFNYYFIDKADVPFENDLVTNFSLAYQNVCEGGIVMAADSSNLNCVPNSTNGCNAKAFLFQSRNNDPIIIDKSVTIDFNNNSVGLNPITTGQAQKNAFLVKTGKTLKIKNSHITNTQGTFKSINGGLAYVEAGGTLILENCRVSNLKADKGAVAYGSGKIIAINSQFDADSANLGSVFYAADSLILKGCTLTNNHRAGHVVYLTATAKMKLGLTVIGDNNNFNSTTARDIFRMAGATITTLGYNLVSNTGGGIWGNSTDFDGVFNKYPVDLVAKKSTYKALTYKPGCNSRALNSGNAAAVGLTTDINGTTRTNDRGAAERGIAKYVTNTSTSIDEIGSFYYAMENSCDSVIIAPDLSNKTITPTINSIFYANGNVGVTITEPIVITSQAKNFKFMGRYFPSPFIKIDAATAGNVVIDGITFEINYGNTGVEKVLAIKSDATIGTVTVQNCLFENFGFSLPNNNFHGYIVGGKNMIIKRNTFSGNKYSPLYLQSNNIVKSNTIVQNTNHTNIEQVTIDGNNNTISNNIFTNNVAGAGGLDIKTHFPFNFYSLNTGSYNFISKYNPNYGFNGSVNDTTGTIASPIVTVLPSLDYQLSSRTRTHALPIGNKNINTGDPNETSPDQRGVPINGRADRGAYEYISTCADMDTTFTTDIRPTQAKLNWVGTTAPTYNLRYRALSNNNWTQISVNGSSKIIQGLSNETDYIWQIQSRCYGGYDSSAYSAPNYFRTRCTLPDSVWLAKKDSSMLTFRWKELPNSTAFTLILKNLLNNTTNTAIVAGTSTEYIFTGLATNTPYQFSLQNSCGSNSLSEPLLLEVKTEKYISPFIKITSPIGNQVLVKCTNNLEWSGSGTSNQFKIEVNDGQGWQVLHSNFTPEDLPIKTYSWFQNPGVSNLSINYTLRISDFNNPALVDTQTFKINNVAKPPVFEAASFEMCKRSTHWLTLAPTIDPLQYIWTLPNGFTGTSYGRAMSITAPNYDTNGIINVVSKNSCSQSPPSSITISTFNTSYILPLITTEITKNVSQIDLFTNTNCDLLAKVTPMGTNPVAGNVTVKSWREGQNLPGFVPRHFEIAPASNATTATGRVTLYFTQIDFDNYNQYNVLNLPNGPTDTQNLANIQILKYAGSSTNGLPAGYPAQTPTLIPNSAITTLWDGKFWAVSFDAVGFSGYFLGTNINCSTNLYEWLGAEDGDWAKPANWNCGVVPTSTSEVYIPSRKFNYPEQNLNVTVKKLTVASGASVKIPAGQQLKIEQ